VFILRGRTRVSQCEVRPNATTMRRSPSAIEWWLRVLTMKEGETMQETMKREQEEMLATLTRANNALSRIFNMEEGEDEDE